MGRHSRFKDEVSCCLIAHKGILEVSFSAREGVTEEYRKTLVMHCLDAIEKTIKEFEFVEGPFSEAKKIYRVTTIRITYPMSIHVHRHDLSVRLHSAYSGAELKGWHTFSSSYENGLEVLKSMRDDIIDWLT